jgi:hypothetical protein
MTQEIVSLKVWIPVPVIAWVGRFGGGLFRTPEVHGDHIGVEVYVLGFYFADVL